MLPNDQSGSSTHHPGEDSILESLLVLGIPAKRILELGCGRGRVTRRLAEAFPHAAITAIDADPDDLAAAARHCTIHAHRVTFVQSDFTSNLDLPGDAFDLAIAAGVLARFPSDIVRRVVQRASLVSTFAVGFDPDEAVPASGTAPGRTHDFASLCQSIGLRSEIFPAGEQAGRLVLAWGGTDAVLTDDDAAVLPGVRLEAEHLSRSLLAEGTPRYARNDDLVAQLGRDFAERASRPFDGLEGGSLLAPGARSSLRERLERVEAELEHLVEAMDREDLSSQFQRDLDGEIPAGATVAVVSDGDDALLALGNREAWHFPQTADGKHVGYSPADSAAAIELLEGTRARGAEYLLLPSTAYWWMEHYQDFARYVVRHYRTIRPDDGDCLIFDLHSAPKH